MCFLMLIEDSGEKYLFIVAPEEISEIKETYKILKIIEKFEDIEQDYYKEMIWC